MKIIGKGYDEFFEKWEILLHGIGKFSWQNVVTSGDTEDDGRPRIAHGPF